MEQPFFNDAGIIVTNVRFIAHHQTFAMAQVSSVRAAADPWFRWNWFLLGGFGLVLLLIGGLATLAALADGGAHANGIGCAAFSLLLGGVSALIALYLYLDRDYYVVVATSGGEVKALRGRNPNLILAVVAALNNALVHRG